MSTNHPVHIRYLLYNFRIQYNHSTILLNFQTSNWPFKLACYCYATTKNLKWC